MQDGIDRKAFSAEVKAMTKDERRRRMREFGEWMQAAARAVGPRSYLGIVFVCIAPPIVGLGFELRPHALYLIPIAIVMLAIGSALNLYSNRRAREWRRLHPFGQWRATRG